MFAFFSIHLSIYLHDCFSSDVSNETLRVSNWNCACCTSARVVLNLLYVIRPPKNKAKKKVFGSYIASRHYVLLSDP